MFRSTARNLLNWWLDFSEDILGADLEPMAYYAEDELDYHLAHPHRRELYTDRPRRGGAIAARPAPCPAPVRRTPPRAGQHHLPR